jgi:hypothetical protein
MNTSGCKETDMTGIAETTKVKITIDDREILAPVDKTILD